MLQDGLQTTNLSDPNHTGTKGGKTNSTQGNLTAAEQKTQTAYIHARMHGHTEGRAGHAAKPQAREQEKTPPQPTQKHHKPRGQRASAQNQHTVTCARARDTVSSA